jgi:hypothetical protein
MNTTIHTGVPLRPDDAVRAWPTPRRLRVMSAVVAAIALTAGIIGALAMLSRQQATTTAANTAEPLVVGAQTLDVAMSDADTTIAGGFLAGPLVPASVQSRFDADMAQAAAALTSASQRAGTDRALGQTLTTLSTGLSSYSGVIATAETNNRLGYPVATAYLAEANNLMRATLLPAAASLYNVEQARLSRDESRARSSTLVVALIILLVLVLLGVLWMQADVGRRFRRMINLGLGTATLLVLGVGVWAVVAAASGGQALAGADHHGTVPLGVLTRARILAQQARADDELTLVTRDADSSYQDDYKTTSRTLALLLSTPGVHWTASEVADLQQASDDWSKYNQAHDVIRSLDAKNATNTIQTYRLAAAPLASAADADLSTGVSTAVASFGHGTHDASTDLSGLPWACLGLMVVAALLVLAGVEPRIREYR